MDSLLSYTNLQMTDSNNNDNSATFSDNLKEDKYSLRPRSLRRITEKQPSKLEAFSSSSNRLKIPSNSKSKPKSAPLSKYRRKTANARERNRMREINQAFETLRKVIPQMQAAPSDNNNNNNEKLTKITTLRLAMKYINALSAALNNPLIRQQETNYLDLDCLLLESDGESLSLSDHSGSILDFPEPSLSPVHFDDPNLPNLLHTDFTDHALEGADLTEFLLA